MLKYVIKRLLLSILILFGVSIILYTLVRLMPDDYVAAKFTNVFTQAGLDLEEALAQMRANYGLDKGIIAGYFSWLGDVFKGDLGYSFQYQRPVSEVIWQNMGTSFAIALISLILYFSAAIPLGIRAAVKQYSIFDYVTTFITMLGISLPSFFFAALMIKLFAVDLGWFDSALGLLSAGFTGNGFEKFLDMCWHLVLPILVVVILNIGSIMRYTRTNTLEVLNADYIRTARAKGLSERTVIYKHAFRNTMIPLVTMMAGILPGLFGGSMIIEQVFGIPGIGQKAYLALKAGDIPFIMGYNMFLAILTVIGILLSDLMYAVVDPRVKLFKK